MNRDQEERGMDEETDEKLDSSPVESFAGRKKKEKNTLGKKKKRVLWQLPNLKPVWNVNQRI